jgi:hypothetical protein
LGLFSKSAALFPAVSFANSTFAQAAEAAKADNWAPLRVLLIIYISWKEYLPCLNIPWFL